VTVSGFTLRSAAIERTDGSASPSLADSLRIMAAILWRIWTKIGWVSLKGVIVRPI